MNFMQTVSSEHSQDLSSYLSQNLTIILCDKGLTNEVSFYENNPF